MKSKLIFLGLSVISQVVASPNLTAIFGSSLSSAVEIILPGDADWGTRVQARWSDYASPTFFGVIKPVTESDIQHTVRLAQIYNIRFLATGGGQSFSDYSHFEGISIDLGNFDSVTLDDTQTYLTIGGAAKYNQLTDLLYNASKELPLASCACPGVVGATLGAGIGPLMGHRGLMIDALESVRLVTADGEIITASHEDNAELFWGIRGAGSNFGIITSATFKLWGITNNGLAMSAGLVFPASVNGSYWRVLQTFDTNMPARLALTNMAFFDRQTNQPYIVLNAIYFGPREEGEPYLERFRKLKPLRDEVKMVPQNKLFPPVLGSCTPGQKVNIHSTAVKRTDPETLESIFADLNRFWRQHIGYQGRLLIPRFANDATAKVHGNNTSFPWRTAIAHM
ncbi:unnamed protein product [Penicillium salamii]|uniref:FAD-binding PCMH-type domain-containing protein n=1 Tax=Penicillium salamii TaxID=1612424 RepID=A0A9W4JAX3_9EURO|nr:unnamed protein product [Penicillium salamii]CAG7989416.1 unnamed protein product [Penicillium salamii]CAG8274671.1 unnamed protein product [Penicillium salamii]CAG8353634.1 unnamed protein product [Penicillium salamii]CAG8357250.1 unnamed protein product [Penicillium salamii]